MDGEAAVAKKFEQQGDDGKNWQEGGQSLNDEDRQEKPSNVARPPQLVPGNIWQR